MDSGLLLARVVFGALMAAHGSQKLFGWFGGYGIAGTGQYFESIGFRPGRLFAVAAGGAETLGGLLLALGLFGPVGPALIVSVMVVALVTTHWGNGLFVETNGVERVLLYGAGAAALGLTGYGAYSLDAALGLSALWTGELSVALLAAGVAAGVLALVARQTAPRAVSA